MQKQALLKITGKVQGVFYRAGAAEKADKLGLVGYARNLSDGSVEVLLQGEEEKIKQFITWAGSGPDRAKVEKVEVKWEPLNGSTKKHETFETY